jgi:hypothetical protein
MIAMVQLKKELMVVNPKRLAPRRTDWRQDELIGDKPPVIK